jgi:hypothetical protein
MGRDVVRLRSRVDVVEVAESSSAWSVLVIVDL